MPFDISHIFRFSPFGTNLLKTFHFCKKFLRTTLRKDPLTSLICLLYRFERVEFGNCHQLYSCWQLPM